MCVYVNPETSPLTHHGAHRSLTAMKVHSQGGVFVIDRHRDLTEEELVGIDAVFRRVRVPVTLDMNLQEFKALL